MSFNFMKTSAAAAAALAIAFALAPVSSAEAQWRGRHGGFSRGGGIALGAGALGAAIIGGALLSRSAQAGPRYVEEGDCYVVRQRVWDEYRGRYVRVNRTVCD